jgi:hypothetical protein
MMSSDDFNHLSAFSDFDRFGFVFLIIGGKGGLDNLIEDTWSEAI